MAFMQDTSLRLLKQIRRGQPAIGLFFGRVCAQRLKCDFIGRTRQSRKKIVNSGFWNAPARFPNTESRIRNVQFSCGNLYFFPEFNVFHVKKLLHNEANVNNKMKRYKTKHLR